MHRLISFRKSAIGTAFVILVVWVACAPTPTQFNIVDLGQKPGEKIMQTLQQDNTNGTAPMNKDVGVPKQVVRNITLSLNSGSNLNESDVRQKIYNQYKV